MNSELIDQVIRGKLRGVPYLGITTADPEVISKEITGELSKSMSGREKPLQLTAVHYDTVRGLFAPKVSENAPNYDAYQRGLAWIESLLDSDNNEQRPQDVNELRMFNGNSSEFLYALAALPPDSIVYFHQANRWLDSSNPDCRPSIQAVANLRNIFKANRRTLVLLGPQMTLPVELRPDTILLDDPLPTPDDIKALIKSQEQLRQVTQDKETLERAAAFTTGLSRFGAEQSLYMSLVNDGKKNVLDLAQLRRLRHMQIEQTKGLKVLTNDLGFDHVAGNDYAKKLIREIMTGNDAPNGIINVEEINWAMAGAKGDNTGVSQDQVSVLLDHMERNGDEGVILFGLPGCSKSWLTECIGPEFGVDTLQLDLNGMKQSELGSSEGHIREALKVANAVCGGKKLWVATCNSVDGLNEALLRRFTLGIVYFDLPTDEEKDAIWDIQMVRYGHMEKRLGSKSKGKKPWADIDTKMWSGADIRNCCRMAYKRKQTIAKMATEVNPVARQDPQMVPTYRNKAHARYRSSHTGEVYAAPGKTDNKTPVLDDQIRQAVV